MGRLLGRRGRVCRMGCVEGKDGFVDHLFSWSYEKMGRMMRDDEDCLLNCAQMMMV